MGLHGDKKLRPARIRDCKMIKKGKLMMLLMAITSVIVVSCNRNQPSPQITAEIENITKLHVAAVECSFNFVQTSIEALDGNGLLPYEVEKRLEDYLSSVDAVLEKMIEDTATNAFDDWGIESVIAQDIRERASKTSIALGDFIPLEVSGKKKMWTYTEMLSGYNFSATLDKSGKEDLIVVGFTKESEKAISKKLEKAITRFNNAYERKQNEPTHLITPDENGYID